MSEDDYQRGFKDGFESGFNIKFTQQFPTWPYTPPTYYKPTYAADSCQVCGRSGINGVVCYNTACPYIPKSATTVAFNAGNSR